MNKLLAALALVVACAGSDGPGPGEFPFDGEGGKTDVFGRALIGPAQPYEPDDTLPAVEERLRTDMVFRRQVAWEIIARTIDPVPLLGLAERAEGSEELTLPGGVPEVSRFQTWYGVDDFKRMFQFLYENEDRASRLRRDPFDEEEIAAAIEFNDTAIDRSSRWPLERFIEYVNRLGVCPEGTPADECARLLQSNFSGASGGNVRITYSPATIRHLLENYGAILDCMDELGGLALSATPEEEANFAFCYEREMPIDAVLIKAQWVRADFDRDIPVYDTDADTLSALLGEGASGTWPEEGNRRADPGSDEIITIKLRNGSTFRLVGLHIMTKELRHWTWITMWWHDQPDSDFGADRPAAITEVGGAIWGNYKMCVVVDYAEGDDDPGDNFDAHPSLAAALRALPDDMGATWCSNGYVEEGRGNARTNCIGCHQHGASTVGADLDGDSTPDPFVLEQVIDDPTHYPQNGRTRIRDVFPSDYLWSASRVDNLFQVIRSEVDRTDIGDGREIDMRVENVLGLEGDAAMGAMYFAENCARCHGADGTGDFGPNLYERVPMRDDETLVRRILLGIGPMPAWDSVFDDQGVADIRRFLRDTFDGPEPPDERSFSAMGLPLAIPDDDPGGVAAMITVPDSFVPTRVRVEVGITHTFQGDLTVELSHGATSVTLHDATGGATDDLMLDVDVAEFAGADAQGTWTLTVVDGGAMDTGTLDVFRLSLE